MTSPTPTSRAPVAFSLGANLGDRLGALQGAVEMLAGSGLLQDLQVSAVYETDPVGGPEQAAYLNAVLVATSSALPIVLLELAHAAEQQFGRTRETRWGPRTLDIDVLVVGETRSDDPALTLPHPRAHERSFVLVPWAEVDPGAELPGYGSVMALRDRAMELAGAEAVRLTPLQLVVPPAVAGLSAG
jgi:2-amino-4-hydroxy-6-hydroxymethyldihydropteridine diphosphokinase